MSRSILNDKRLRQDIKAELLDMFRDRRIDTSSWSDDEYAELGTRIILDGLVTAAIERMEGLHAYLH